MNLPPKSLFESRLLAVDPSLTQSGWAVFSLNQETPLAWGVIKGGSSRENIQNRLSFIQESVLGVLEKYFIGAKDYLVCEGPAPVTLNPSSALKVEQVRGVFETLARTKEVCVPGRLNPRTVQSELLGIRGKQLPRDEVKRIARNVALSLFNGSNRQAIDVLAESQDVVDAFLIGTLARSRIIRAFQTGVVVESVFQEQDRRRSGRSSSKGRGLRWSSSSISGSMK